MSGSCRFDGHLLVGLCAEIHRISFNTVDVVGELMCLNERQAECKKLVVFVLNKKYFIVIKSISLCVSIIHEPVVLIVLHRRTPEYLIVLFRSKTPLKVCSLSLRTCEICELYFDRL